MKRALVLGAGGVMGARVCELLRGGLPELDVVPAARRDSGLGPGARSVDVTDRPALRAALADVDLLVNAVGPYAYDPAPILAACFEAGCHYLDLAEAPGFVAAVERSAAGAPVCVVSGCSTVPGMVELLALQLDSNVDRVAVWLSIGSANPAGFGLLYGLLRPLGRSAPDGSRYFGGLLPRETSDARRLRFGRYPAAFRGDQLALRDGTRVPAHFHTGFDRVWLNALLVAAAPLLQLLGDGALRGLARAVLPASRVVARLGTRRGVLRVEGLGRDGAVVDFCELHAERNGLDVPAAPVLWAARRLAEGADGLEGPRRLPELVAFDEAAGWLREAGYRLVGVPR